MMRGRATRAAGLVAAPPAAPATADPADVHIEVEAETGVVESRAIEIGSR